MADESEKATRKKPTKKRASSPGQAASAKGKPWTFPKNSLEDAIGLAKAIEEKNAGNPMPARDIAVAVGFRQSSDWRFLDLLRSANQYALVTGSGANATVHLAQLGQDVVAPGSPSQRLRRYCARSEASESSRQWRSTMGESVFLRTNSS